MTARPEVDLGVLSGGESAYAAEARARGELHDTSREIAKARAHYTAMLNTAQAAARQLNECLDRGLAAAPDGGIAHNEARRLINAFAWANVQLQLAAQWVSDAEDRDVDELRLVESVNL